MALSGHSIGDIAFLLLIWMLMIGMVVGVIWVIDPTLRPWRDRERDRDE